MARTEPLSNVDAAWLGMEDPTNLMMVSGILTFDDPIDFEKLKLVLQNRLLQFERFRQRVVQSRLPMTPPYWEDDANFDIDAHVHRVGLPAPYDQPTLQSMVSDLMSVPLDFTKPLWQVHVIENYEAGSAVMVRLHHCIADGIALVMVLLSMTDFTADAPQPEASQQEQNGDEGMGGVLGALFRQATSTATAVRKATTRLVSESVESIINPAHALELAMQGSDSAVAASRLVLRTPDPQTIFKGPLGVAKRAAWSKPLPLKDVKAIKNVTGGTVNDVLVSAMTGALRRYMVGRGEDVAGLNFRAAVPVNLRTQEEMSELGNKFGIVFLSLPVGIGDTLERLAEVRTRMDALKNSKEAVAAFGILKGIGMSPRDVQEELVKMFGSKATTVLTNVPGPPMPLYLAGSQISGLMFWVPQSGRVGMGISILSYAGKVFLGIATDAGLVPDPDTILDDFYEEFAEMLALVQQAEEIEVAKATAVATAADTDLEAVKGIGPTFAQRLRVASIDTVTRLANSPADTIAQALGVSETRAKALIAEAVSHIKAA